MRHYKQHNVDGFLHQYHQDLSVGSDEKESV